MLVSEHFQQPSNIEILLLGQENDTNLGLNTLLNTIKQKLS